MRTTRYFFFFFFFHFYEWKIGGTSAIYGAVMSDGDIKYFEHVLHAYAYTDHVITR